MQHQCFSERPLGGGDKVSPHCFVESPRPPSIAFSVFFFYIISFLLRPTLAVCPLSVSLNNSLKLLSLSRALFFYTQSGNYFTSMFKFISIDDDLSLARSSRD